MATRRMREAISKGRMNSENNTLPTVETFPSFWMKSTVYLPGSTWALFL
jgi:hypothetical protein